MAGTLQLCPTADVPEGGAIKVERDDLILAVFNLGGRYFVTDDACTHGPGSLSEGEIEGEEVECNFHNGAFNIITGVPALMSTPAIVVERRVRRIADEKIVRERGLHDGPERAHEVPPAFPYRKGRPQLRSDQRARTT